MVLYTIRGGGHSISGGVALGLPSLTGPLIGYTNGDTDTDTELWDFFRRHSRAGRR